MDFPIDTSAKRRRARDLCGVGDPPTQDQGRTW
jgi:hypothetical protein